MKAWIVAVGSELLTPFRVDTNSLAITERLNAIGCEVRFKAVVGDDVDALADVLRRGIGAVDLIICTGGLGPTEDDITRDALARVLDVPLDLDEAIAEELKRRFERRGMVMPAINRRQAMVPRGAIVLENARGTAPGLWIERDGTGIALLPGPPREMKPMLEALVVDRLAPKTSGAGLFRRVLKITGQPESDVDARAQPIYGRWLTAPVPIATTILAVMGQIELHLSASAKNKADADEALDAAVNELTQHLGPMVYSTDGRGLEAVIGDLLRAKRSDDRGRGVLFRRPAVVAADGCARQLGLLRSRRGLLQQRSEDRLARSAGTADRRARRGQRAGGAGDGRRAFGRAPGPTSAIGITGIAGPGGGTPEKPVGTVVDRGASRRAATRSGRSSSSAAATWSSFSRRRPR